MGIENSEGIENRKFQFCSSFEDQPLSHLFVECPECTKLFAACCSHRGGEQVCHHYQLVFTDGACSNNGRNDARAGLGITMGGEEFSWSILVDDIVDPDGPRTSQRAELLAAIEGLKKLYAYRNPDDHKKSKNRHDEASHSSFIVVTDSEYVVRGITEWFPSWRRRDWRTSVGKRPANLDLFMKLDEYITSIEEDCADVGFFHVPRGHNQKADLLAKRAARN